MRAALEFTGRGGPASQRRILECPHGTVGAGRRPQLSGGHFLFLLAVLLGPFVWPDDLDRVPSAREPVVLFFGTSLTAGYEVDDSVAFPGRIRSRIDSIGWPFRVRVAGRGGATAGGGARRLRDIREENVRVLVLELGANDALLRMPIDSVRVGLKRVIRVARSRWRNVRILLASLRAPPDRRPKYREEFLQMYRRVAEAQQIARAPSILRGVAGEQEMTLRDGIHPNATGHARIAENIWPHLRPLLEDVVKEMARQRTSREEVRSEPCHVPWGRRARPGSTRFSRGLGGRPRSNLLRRRPRGQGDLIPECGLEGLVLDLQ